MPVMARLEVYLNLDAVVVRRMNSASVTGASMINPMPVRKRLLAVVDKHEDICGIREDSKYKRVSQKVGAGDRW